MAKTFAEYYQQLHEADENENKTKNKETAKEPGALASKVSLGDGNDFPALMISDDPHSENYGKNKNLAPIVRAFKKGANWGWSKDEASGEDKPVKVGSKKLYLVGGAVRDHLLGKTPRNMELATNASPDEVYHILKQNEFEFVQSPKEPSKVNVFWVEKVDANKRPFGFGLRVNNETFELEIFNKTPRGVEGDMESGTHAQDASGRDFTMNAMSILLSNDNGPNKELQDFFGGIHDLASKRVSTIGDMSEKFQEDPKRLLRYVRMLDQYGDPAKLSTEEREAIKKSTMGLKKLKPDQIMSEFKRGMERDDCNCRRYLSIFRDLGLLDSLFPGKIIDSNFPKELDELNDKAMPLAYMLRHNSPDSLSDLGLDNDMSSKLGFLIKSVGLKDSLEPDSLYDLLTGYQKSGYSSRKLRDWLMKIGRVDPNVTDAFLNFAKSPRVKAYMKSDDGAEEIAPEFADVFDPFTGKPNSDLLERRKRALEHKRFQKELSFMRPV